MTKKILWVDDGKDWCDVVSVTFQDPGYKSLTAKNATQSLLLADDIKLSLITPDPDLNGEDNLMLMSLFKRNQPGVPVSSTPV